MPSSHFVGAAAGVDFAVEVEFEVDLVAAGALDFVVDPLDVVALLELVALVFDWLAFCVVGEAVACEVDEAAVCGVVAFCVALDPSGAA